MKSHGTVKVAVESTASKLMAGKVDGVTVTGEAWASPKQVSDGTTVPCLSRNVCVAQPAACITLTPVTGARCIQLTCRDLRVRVGATAIDLPGLVQRQEIRMLSPGRGEATITFSSRFPAVQACVKLAYDMLYIACSIARARCVNVKYICMCVRVCVCACIYVYMYIYVRLCMLCRLEIQDKSLIYLT